MPDSSPAVPEAAIEAAAEGMKSTVPNQDGVLWMFDEVIDQRTGMTQPHEVTLKDAARAALSAALPHLREQIAQEIEAAQIVGRFTYPGLVQVKAAAIARGGKP